MYIKFEATQIRFVWHCDAVTGKKRLKQDLLCSKSLFSAEFWVYTNSCQVLLTLISKLPNSLLLSSSVYTLYNDVDSLFTNKLVILFPSDSTQIILPSVNTPNSLNSHFEMFSQEFNFDISSYN